MPENPAPITTASKSGVASGIHSSFILFVLRAQIMHDAVHISHAKQALSTSGGNRALRLAGSVSFRGELRSRQAYNYRKLYQATEIRSRSAATRCTWMVRRCASETVWLMYG